MTLAALQARAQLYHCIRQFFYERSVLEVETPVLCSHTVTDVYIDSIASGDRFLQTSPEYAMKRLLAQGSGCIYQISKSFRASESGRYHNPEFTMLEWYRVGFDHHALMDEVDALVQLVLHTQPAERHSYQACFLTHTQLDPFSADISALHAFIMSHHLLQTTSDIDYDTALQVILSDYIEPKIGQDRPYFLYDFPVSQAALARIRKGSPSVAERFELYYKGFELANGFHELTDAGEQQERFKQDQAKRHSQGRFVPDIDSYLIAALQQGLPDVAGVAVGLDRLLMLAYGAGTIGEVLAFPWASI